LCVDYLRNITDFVHEWEISGQFVNCLWFSFTNAYWEWYDIKYASCEAGI